MPELPEVETVRRGLEPALKGKCIRRVTLARADLRFPFPPDFVERVQGCRLEAVRRRAKYLLLDLDSGITLIIHLGMSGSLRIEKGKAAATPGAFALPRNAADKHDHVVFDLEDGTRVTYNDPRRFGLMDLADTGALAASRHLARIGIEPLGPEMDAAALARLFAGRLTSLKAALLDQRLVAGLGNIYVCEALWRARLSPTREAGTIADRNGRPNDRARRLAAAIRAVLGDAVAAGGSSLRNYVQADGELGMFQHSFDVYDREDEACRRKGCRGTIRRIVQSGRSTFLCPTCQA